MRLFLSRVYDDDTRTLGVLTVYDGLSKVFECKTLEPPWADNAREESCIPPGAYHLTSRTSAKFKDHYWLNDVWGRDFILIHVGNFPQDTTGCILVGEGYADIDADGRMDVAKSKSAFDRLKRVLRENKHEIYIAGKVPLRK